MEPSPFYPPRARWYGPAVRGLKSCGRGFRSIRLPLPGKVSLPGFLLGLLIPGWAFLATGRRRAGRGILAGTGFALAVFFVGIGYPIASLALAAVVILHTVSVAYLLGLGMTFASVWRRFAVVLGVMLILMIGVYRPLRGYLENHLFIPLRVQDRVVVVSSTPVPASIQRGQILAYRTHEIQVGNVRLPDGLSLGTVLALPRERIDFHPGRLEISGRLSPVPSFLPSTGSWTVPENHWFIWPDSSMPWPGNLNAVEPGALERILTRLLLVPETDLLGTAYRRWFWRRQQPL